MSNYCIILTTTDTEERAENLANILIQSNLVACVAVDKVKSFFQWQGDCKNNTEYRLMIKTITSNYHSVERLIIANHNYQVPQIIQLDITQGSSDYLNWVRDTCLTAE